MMKRRAFIQRSFLAGVGFVTAPGLLAAQRWSSCRRLTVLHTNDTHSQIEPFSANHKLYANQGGVSRRAELIRRIRSENEQVILLDAGDVFQGTPYFNEFKGELEMKVMQAMGYDAMTMGNHDFDIGLDGFYTAYHAHAKFPVACSNYDFTETILSKIATPFQILQKGSIRVGIFGLGVELEGLVGKKLFGETRYLDPVHVANEWAPRLRHDYKCDLVICLSHLGYSYKTSKISDLTLAELTSDIDLIIGGHTHTFLQEPTVKTNKAGKTVLINQVGFGGINLGRIDFIFDDKENHAQGSLLRIG